MRFLYVGQPGAMIESFGKNRTHYDLCQDLIASDHASRTGPASGQSGKGILPLGVPNVA